ncbi:F0F1 ATP synthase subunit delta [Amorphus sp. 3PC139-8]|uniref:F0F1 ATP synthase subunit delta n=1 Tax=Amorphus sp. 3PC139-8 TaxID=2735676 RepID=UPI00345CB096
MHIDWWTLALQTINALVLIWLLSRFLFRPVANMIEARRAEARRLLDEAEARRKAADEERAKAEADEQALAAERGQKLQEAAAEGEKQKASILAAARAEAEKLRAEATAEIERERARAEATTKDRAAQLAVDIAAKLVDRLPDNVRVLGFVDGLAAGVADLKGPIRAEIGADGAPVQLTAPRELTADERAACQSALSKALGREIEIEIDVDPALIAGLELNAEHAVVTNNLRADLTQILTELTRHERT